MNSSSFKMPRLLKPKAITEIPPIEPEFQPPQIKPRPSYVAKSNPVQNLAGLNPADRAIVQALNETNRLLAKLINKLD